MSSRSVCRSCRDLAPVMRRLLLIGLLWTNSSPAQSGCAGPVIVRKVTGPSVTGRLVDLDKKHVRIADETGKETPIRRTEVIGIAALQPLAHRIGPDDLVLLTNLDCLAATVTAIADEMLTADWLGEADEQPIAVPLEQVRSFVLQQPDHAADRSRLRRAWSLLKPDEDRVLLSSGNTAHGELISLDQNRARVMTALGPVEMSRDDIAAIILNAELASIPDLPETYMLMSLADGSRLTLVDVGVDEAGQVHAQSIQGFEIHVRVDDVERMQFFSERVVSLADREPLKSTFTPYLSETHPMVAHRNVHGGPLELRGTQYAIGLGMHSHSEVTYDLTGDGFNTFTATIGIDDQAAGGGSVTFAVDLDGQRVYESGEITGSSDPLIIEPVDVSSAAELTLTVEFGRQGNIRDLANWCDPLLIR